MHDKNVFIFKDVEEAAEIIKSISGKGSLVVLKASRLQRLEQIIDRLKE